MSRLATPDYIIANYDAFQSLLPSILAEHHGQFALLRERQIVEYFSTAGDAYKAGKQLFSDGQFSIQEVVAEPLDLGFFSHAVH
ncbi:MAG: hypothetical protein IT317_23835 [Anaerolineales bacterium]|nr:hypothetical protein [Anaerolineales bacterium]